MFKIDRKNLQYFQYFIVPYFVILLKIKKVKHFNYVTVTKKSR